MKKFLNTLAAFTAILSALMMALLYKKNVAPKGFILWIPKLVAGALAPFIGMAGLVSAGVGLVTGAPLTVLTGLFSAGTAVRYLQKTVWQPHQAMNGRFNRAFGSNWQQHLAEKAGPAQQGAMLPYRWTWFAARGPQPRHLRDVPFHTDPLSGRTLLCDLWAPPESVPATGLAILYLHGSAWYLGDKDFGTRDFFRHLTAQGHLVMDAQYRLAPEVDIFGMIGDVKQAVAWLKANAADYGVDPQRVVLSGGSAGGHLALLAAYAPDHPRLTPPELQATDLSVRAVAAYYGPADMAACYRHTNQHLTPFEELRRQQANPAFGEALTRTLRAVTGNPNLGEEMAAKSATMSMAGRLEPVLGGTPEQAPEAYALASPITHAGPGCPPTFLAQGADDLIVPLEANQQLAQKLRAAGVPVVELVFPQTEHAFDLAYPLNAPGAQSALYELDRFLALV